jgi:hypothetical protein
MDELKCSNPECGGALGSEDAFCGLCGTPAPPRAVSLPGPASQPNGALNRQPDGAAAPTAVSAAFFGHEPPRSSGPLSNATRYLCAAAYLNQTFANRVMRELIATRRAVAPSLGIDLGPIIWHCQRARRNIWIRNLTLVAIVVAGLILDSSSTISFLSWAFVLGWLPPRLKWTQRRLVEKILIALLYFLVWSLLGVIVVFLVFASILTSFTSSFGTGASPDVATTAAGAEALKSVGTFVLLVALTWGTEFAFLQVISRTLIQHLKPGTAPPDPAPGPASARIAAVQGAQWGNITLYATEDPFIGAGVEADLDRHWSIAIRLDPADPARRLLQVGSGLREYVQIDPVELHQAIRQKLFSLNDPSLPVNERVATLTVFHRLVGSGLLRWDSPLVDRSQMTPYSHAAPEAIDAVIRHPQAGLRYYQHVAVYDEGPPVLAGGRQVLDSADQGIAVSAFIYLAVEGRHLYLQFVLTALPPISGEYRMIDLLPTLSPGRMLALSLWNSFKRFLRVVADCPAGIFWQLRTWLGERRAEGEALTADAHGAVAADLGTEVSIRELGSQERFGSYIRKLDAEKYNSIIERAVLETVQDFLASKGVDTSAFTGSALNIINGNVIGSVSGGSNQFGGANSRFTQHARSGT